MLRFSNGNNDCWWDGQGRGTVAADLLLESSRPTAFFTTKEPPLVIASQRGINNEPALNQSFSLNQASLTMEPYLNAPTTTAVHRHNW